MSLASSSPFHNAQQIDCSQMTHSIDSFITDSANSATALFTGKKTTVDALNVWVDSVSLAVSFLHFSLTLAGSQRTFSTTPKWKPLLSSLGGKSVEHWALYRLLISPMLPLVCLFVFSCGRRLTLYLAAMCSHTRSRGQSIAVVTEFLTSAEAFSPAFKWPTSCLQPDVIFG